LYIVLVSEVFSSDLVFFGKSISLFFGVFQKISWVAMITAERSTLRSRLWGCRTCVGRL